MSYTLRRPTEEEWRVKRSDPMPLVMFAFWLGIAAASIMWSAGLLIWWLI